MSNIHHCLSYPIVIYHYLSFTIVCCYPLSVIPHFLSLPIVNNFQLSIILKCLSYSLLFSHVYHSSLCILMYVIPIVFSKLSVIAHCLSFPSVCHSPLSIISYHYMSVTIVCHHPLYVIPHVVVPHCHYPLSAIYRAYIIIHHLLFYSTLPQEFLLYSDKATC